MSWLSELLGVVWMTVAAAAGPIVPGNPPAAPSSVSRSTADRATCETSQGLVATTACSRAIASGEFTGRELAHLYVHRAAGFRGIGNLDAAVTDYNRAIDLDPTDPSTYCRRAEAWRDKGAFDLAIADYGEAIRRDPLLASALVHRGLIYERKRQLRHARADFSAALALPPKYVHSYSAQVTARERLAILWTDDPSTSASAQY